MRRSFVVAGLALLAAGCGMMTPSKEPPARPFIATRWEAILDLPLSGEQPSLRFGDGRVEGFGGCNRFVARATQDAIGARAIIIGRIEMDRRICTDPSAQMAETRLIEVLQTTTSYEVLGEMLTITGSAGTMRFKANP
jgi:heat shock protein HslJ